MRALTRTRDQNLVHSDFWGPGRRKLARLLRADANGERQFDSDKWKPAKEQLKAESFNKCAYCEDKAAASMYGDVEHFRPKSIYWWLAYSYENYLFSCQLCNQQFKKDHFPLRKAAWVVPAVPGNLTDEELAELVCRLSPDPCDEPLGLKQASFRKALRNEGALLLNPYYDDPDKYFAWQADHTLQEVWLVPRTAAGKKFVAAAEQYYGLNRYLLKQDRYLNYVALELARDTLDDPGASAALKVSATRVLAALTAPEAAYSGMCSYFARTWGLL